MKFFNKKINKKIFSIDSLIKKLSLIKKNKIVALCHGTFDIVHPGHLRHLTYSKQKSDILIASITADKYVTKKREGPFVPDHLRAFNLASLELVDFVIIDYNVTPLSLLSKLKPNYYVKGFEYNKKNIHPKTKEEIKVLNKYGGEVLFSPGDIVYSSTAIQNINKPNLKYEKLISLMEFEKISFLDLIKTVKKFNKVKIHLIGDTIIDKYNYCTVLGQTTKTPTFSVKKDTEQQFLGGAGIVAAHLKALGSQVIFTTVIGQDKVGKYVLNEINKQKIKSNCIIDSSRSTTFKERFWADNQKLLQVDIVDNHSISEKIKNKIEKIIHKTNSDAVIFSDFRHGIFNKESISIFTNAMSKSSFKVADSQVATRWGNITEFKDFDLITPNEKEARFSVGDQDSTVDRLTQLVYKNCKFANIILKLGKRGIYSLSKRSKQEHKGYSIDSFVENLVDPVGSGDALLAYSTLSMLVSKSLLISSIIGSFAAAIACENHGNEPILIEDMLKKISDIEKRSNQYDER